MFLYFGFVITKEKVRIRTIKLNLYLPKHFIVNSNPQILMKVQNFQGKAFHSFFPQLFSHDFD